MDEREKNLPKWAQDLILVLRLEGREKDRQLAVANKQAAKGSTGKVIADCLGGEGFPLDDRAMIRFEVPGGKIDVTLRERGTLLDLNSTGTLLILPRASNSAHFKIEERS